MKEVSEEVATSQHPPGRVLEMRTPRECANCKKGGQRDVTYRFLRGDGTKVIELCPRCMAWSILPNVLEADREGR